MRRLLFVAAFLLCCSASAAAQPGGPSVYVYETSLAGVKCQPTQRALWVIRSGASAGVYRCSAADTFAVVGPFTGGTVTSPLRAPDGTASAPAYSFSAETNLGFYRRAGTVIAIGRAGTDYWDIDTQTPAFQMKSDFYFGWSPSTPDAQPADTRLYRDAANTLGLRNAANAQRLNIGNTFTSASNREDLSLYFSSNVAHIGATTTGGTARPATRLRRDDDRRHYDSRHLRQRRRLHGADYRGRQPPHRLRRK